MQISVRLRDVIIDPTKPMDLTAMPTEKATALLRKAYGFLAADMSFQIQDGMVVITVDPERRGDEATARDCYDRGLKQAKAGRFEKAAGLFARTLKIVPEHTEARRNLAMALLNARRMEDAKDQLIDVLRLAPDDTWAYVLLGNIYAQHQNDLETGERFYDKALELDPKDVRVLTNLAALKIERKDHKGALSLFEQALALDSSQPNAYYGLAMLQNDTGMHREALATLDRMFDAVEWSDVRAAELRMECREFYLRLSAQIAEAEHITCWKAIEAYRDEIADATGEPVDLVEDNSLEDTTAMSVPAWETAGNSVVRYNSRGRAVIPHIVGREIEAIRREHDARQAGKGCRYRYVADNPERMTVMGAHVRQLEERGAGASPAEFVEKVIDTLMPRLLLTPLDLVYEYGLWIRHPAIRSSQTVGLYLHARQKRTPLEQSEVSRALPAKVRQAHETAGAAWAIFIDKLCGGRTAYAAEYARCPGIPLARELADIWSKAVTGLQPGEEHTLVRQFVRAMQLETWLEITTTAR